MINKWTKVQAVREAGMVRRCHIVAHHGEYNIAQHSFGAASLLLLLHPAPSLNLIKAIMWHDVGERWMGDMPSPTKRANAELGQLYEMIEHDVLEKLGLIFELDRSEQHWLRAVDVLDLFMWCREEYALGNRAVNQMMQNCNKVLCDMADDRKLPDEVWSYFSNIRGHEYKRLSDYFDDVISGPQET